MSTVDILCPSSQAMEVFEKQEEGEHPLSHLCKICSKRFLSGTALGGHMRAHVPAFMASDTLIETEFQKSKRPRASKEKSMEEKDDEDGLNGKESNLMYALRRNPKRSRRFADWDYLFLLGDGFDSKFIDSSLNCDMCGKEFSSRKGLFGHMKSHSETHQDSGDAHREESLKRGTQHEEEGSGNDAEIENEIDHPSGSSSRSDEWMKGKKSKRPRYAVQFINPREQFGLESSKEEEDMAMCLIMLANGLNSAQNPQFQAGAVQTGSGDLKLPNTSSQLLKCSRKKPKAKKINGDAGLYYDDEVKKAMYKCTTCSRVFHSHQALGGHRAGHNKVKSCFSHIREENESLEEEITDEELITEWDSHGTSPKERTKDPGLKARDETTTIHPPTIPGKKSKVHECSVCHKVFASGQALGGHKRCHWGRAGASDTNSTISSNKETPTQQQMPITMELLDLNLPAPVDEDCDAGNLNHLGSNAVDSPGVYAQIDGHGLPETGYAVVQ